MYLSTSTHPHICTSISHLYIHTVTPSHPPSLSFCLSVFLSVFLHVLSLTCVDLHLDTLTSADLPLHLHTYAHLYRTCASTLSLLHIRPLFLSFYISFSLHILNFTLFTTSYSITDCIKNSWLLDKSVFIVSKLGSAEQSPVSLSGQPSSSCLGHRCSCDWDDRLLRVPAYLRCLKCVPFLSPVRRSNAAAECPS